MPDITVYGYMSTVKHQWARDFKVVWLLHELNIPFQYKVTRPREGQVPPDFLEVNPCGTIPALKDGDVKMGESTPTLVYLAKKYAADGKQFYPFTTLEQQAQADHLLYYGTTTVENICVGAIFRHNLTASQWCYSMIPRFPELSEEGRSIFRNRVGPALTHYLGDKDYFMGDFTVIDIVICCPLLYAMVMEEVSEDKFPKLWAWLQRLLARPAYIAASQFKPAESDSD
eukprot:TRINITY_DN87469_c0_g1_i1.p1 TRINITY_DN87469_c0_g1~~TRINITY_DN87469_c0_g1_i1.p1  ORF type:complete len:228 (-),score=16.00 TRINITY_DN87469_c0_g1_i1:7-690(-)